MDDTKNRGEVSTFVPFTLPLTPAATLRIFVAQLAFEAHLDALLAAEEAGFLAKLSPRTAERALHVAVTEANANTWRALALTEVR